MRGVLPVLAAVALSGCASSVTLLPGENGAKTGSVVLLDPKTGEERAALTDPNARARTAGRGVGRKTLAAEKVDRRYGRLVADLPPPARSFDLFFREGSTDLLPESEATLKALFAEVAARGSGVDIQIVGHTDTVGSNDDNDALSVARAREIRDSLVTKGLRADITRVSGRGERDLLVDTGDDVREWRNRRAEVVVR
jgi:outer membrane protein OmpA-like peptidoglycan-associated protein